MRLLLGVVAFTGLVSAVGGPAKLVLDYGSVDDAGFPLALYIARAVPLGVAVTVLAILMIVNVARMRPSAAILFAVSAAVQGADSVIGVVRGDVYLAVAAALFATLQAIASLVAWRKDRESRADITQ